MTSIGLELLTEKPEQINVLSYQSDYTLESHPIGTGEEGARLILPFPPPALLPDCLPQKVALS